ncbi:aspartyl-phosphate phosphatase Spo0E family protein [Paenibacillus thiaminolyticus]|uniref:aspartyl-phosphate phosphatase Spo0E family protein n=1 Tax=Paenibacillus thiaminolyticus TaxID=49283 RepID=UPI003B987F2D
MQKQTKRYTDGQSQGAQTKLIHITNQKGKLTDDEVVHISQQLEIYILELQKCNRGVTSLLQ